MVTSDFRPEVKILPFRACASAMHPAIIIGTVRSLWTWLWGRYHVQQNAFLVFTALHAMQTRSSDEISVCPSVRPSVCLSVRLSNACIVTKRKKDMFRFLYHTKEHLS